MKYSVGTKVRIRSNDWYLQNKRSDNNIECGETFFTREMVLFCSSIMTIDYISPINGMDFYRMKEDKGQYCWTDEMIEELVEEESKPKLKYKVGDEVRIKGTDIRGTVESIIRGQLIVNYEGSKIPYWPEDVVLMKSVEEETKPKYEDEVNGEYYSTPKYLVRPNGYQFVDENGNVINAMKIVLEKKKKEYPKTYEECCEIIHSVPKFYVDTHLYSGALGVLYKLLICRDAYWVIAGEEMGLDGLWEPDWNDEEQDKYGFHNEVKYTIINSAIFVFPTEEMRDAFKENFKKEIKMCKELL